MKKLILLIFVVAASLNAQAVQGQIGQVPVVAAADNSPVGGAGNLTTVGSVPYVSASGILNQDAGQFVWDATNNRLGIGTATPGVALDVTGVVRAASEANAINTINIGLVVQRTSNDSQLSLSYKATPDAWVIGSSYNSTGAYKPIALATSDLERMRITASGNVGIGTTAPVGTLHVKGGQGSPSLSADTNNINVVNSSTAAQLVTGAYATSPYAIWMQVKDSANTSTSYPLVLNPLGGNVGIGTTTPAAPLQVGTAVGSPATNGNAAIINAANTTLSSRGGNLQVITTNSSAVDLGGSIGLGGQYNTLANSVEFASIAGRKENGTAANFAGYLQFVTTADGVAPTEKMRITSAGSVLIGGTTDGAYRLDVAKAGASGTARFYDQTASTGVTYVAVQAGANQLTTDIFKVVNNGNVGLFTIGSGGEISNWIPGQYTKANEIGYLSGNATNAGIRAKTLLAGTLTDAFQVANNGNFSIGSGILTNNYKFDVQNSGSSGTARFYDQTATTGSTLAVFRAGVAQSGNVLEVQNNAGTVIASVGSTGNLYSANALSVGATFSVVTLYSPSDGVLRLTDNAGTSFNRLQFGGTTSSFPSIQRSTTKLFFRLADDSAGATVRAGGYESSDGTAGATVTTCTGFKNGLCISGT